jgi:hypothetical protein
VCGCPPAPARRGREASWARAQTPSLARRGFFFRPGVWGWEEGFIRRRGAWVGAALFWAVCFGRRATGTSFSTGAFCSVALRWGIVFVFFGCAFVSFCEVSRGGKGRSNINGQHVQRTKGKQINTHRQAQIKKKKKMKWARSRKHAAAGAH